MEKHPYPIEHFLSRKVKMVPLWPDKTPGLAWGDKSNFSSNPEQIKRWRNQFYAFASQLSLGGGLLMVDLDEQGSNHAKDVHGRESFEALCSRAGVNYPSIEDWPAKCVTPSGSYHLWFRYAGPPIPKVDDGDGVEIFHDRSLATIPGSVLNKGSYTFFGDLSWAPVFHPRLAELAREDSLRRRDLNRKANTYLKNKVPRTMPEVWDEVVSEGYVPASSYWNDFMVQFIAKAKRLRFSRTEARDYLESEVPSDADSYKEIGYKIDSIYGGTR